MAQIKSSGISWRVESLGLKTRTGCERVLDRRSYNPRSGPALAISAARAHVVAVIAVNNGLRGEICGSD